MLRTVLAVMLGGVLAAGALYGATKRFGCGRVPASTPGQKGDAIIIGCVSDDEGTSLAGVRVTIERMNISAATGSDGVYRLVVPATRVNSQRVTIAAQLTGYQPHSTTLVLIAGEIRKDLTLARDQALLSRLQAESASVPALAMRGDFSKSTARGPAPMYGNMPSPTAATVDLRDADELVVMERREMAPPTAPGRSRTLAYKRALSARQAESDDGIRAQPDATQGTMRVRSPEGEIVAELPLRHTDVSAEISAFLARTVVKQSYRNPYERVIEAVYVFPLPTMAAVNDFVMEVGGRRIVGIVRPRAEAERLYQEALSRGQTASLLTQERPNIFTQSIANIASGDSVDVTITYFERLEYAHDQYEYVFPMVVGPRYIAGTPQGRDSVQLVSGGSSGGTPDGGGWSPNTDRVPDASRITPPVLKPGVRSGHDISVRVTLDAGLPITSINSVAHQVEMEKPSDERRIVRLAAGEQIPNRDFVLRWSVAGAETQFGVLTHRTAPDSAGYLTLTMQPPGDPRDDQVMPRELTFVLDVSGSMMGQPVEMAKRLISQSLDALRPDDRFNLVYFSGTNAQLWERAHRRSPEAVGEAKAFLRNLNAGGGTEMIAGLERALHAQHDRGVLQMFVLITDGYVGEEEAILRLVEQERGDARFFAFGIGSSVNRHLIEGVGEHGGGMSFTVLPRDGDGAERAVSQLFAAIDSPVLVDVRIDWNGLPVEDVYPHELRDLFAGQTINVLGRYTSAAKGTAYVMGRIGARQVRYAVPVDLPGSESANGALAPTWARAKIHDLSAQMVSAGGETRDELERRITDLAVQYHLVSQYTAFVAVDESRIVGDGHPLRVMQPLELPEGVSYAGVFGEQPVGPPMRIGAWGLDVQSTSSGKVRVGAATGAAAKLGIHPGSVITSINTSPVRDLAGLEAMLLQSGRGRVRLTFEPGGAKELVAP